MYDYCFKKSIDFGCCNGDDDDAHKDFFNFFMLKKKTNNTNSYVPPEHREIQIHNVSVTWNGIRKKNLFFVVFVNNLRS